MDTPRHTPEPDDRGPRPDIDAIINTTTRYQPQLSDPLVAPYRHVSSSASNNQNVRTRFLQAFNVIYAIDSSQVLAEIGTIIQMFHDSSLLIDDIEDDSVYRRGKLAAHRQYGMPLTLNCGNLMYFVALQRAQDQLLQLVKDAGGAGDPQALKLRINDIIIGEMLNLHRGQGLDIYWRDNLHQLRQQLPSIDDYLEMVKHKTGGLFRLSLQLMALVSSQFNDDLMAIANLLGVIYQIRDDYMNVNSQQYADSKGMAGEDLLEGKLSLPILWCLQHADASPVHDILFQYTSASDRRKHMHLVGAACDYLASCGAMDFTASLMVEYRDKVLDLLQSYLTVSGSKLESIILALTQM
ncbi:hypothetical protein DIURU_000506 [Diutina rugosa]|uniref:Uncharacterized protein n=1 Tax=Diutina rugosa TaxID=5481 RepID=A0A642UXW9_DIURU|nr:uncharacterized protein DIURU_000506 [Diutina rugosa]KAA8907580.1 hypothetical protein DIURU_000506 [Diutina rugosa]